MRLLPKNQTALKGLELTLCVCSLTFALPMSIALFEQRAMLTRDQIEEEDLKNLKYAQFKRDDGKVIKPETDKKNDDDYI